MKFYESSRTRIYEASPFSVSTENVHLTYQDDDAFPFILSDIGLLVAPYGQEHPWIQKRCKQQGIKYTEIMLGRYWANTKSMAFWDNFSDYKDKLSYCVDQVARHLKKRFGISPSNITFYFEARVKENEQHGTEYFVVEIPVPELISLNITGDASEAFWRLKEREKSNEGPIASNGMSYKDMWRHYGVVGESENPVKLDTNDLRYIVENVIKEYHKGQQLILPFDGNDEPYNYMQFIEWLEEVGKYGKLPSVPEGLKGVFENVDILYDMGISTFYFGMGEEFDSEGYYYFLSDFIKKHGEGILVDGYDADKILDEIGCIDDTASFLTKEGVELWKNAIIEKGREEAQWWSQNRLMVNENGLIYCERMIGLKPVMDRHHETEEYNNQDYYEVLNSNYSGIGECWSYSRGGGQIYFNYYGTQDALLKGWVSPSDVDWGSSISLDSMGEQELRLDYGATVQLDSVEVWTSDEDGNYGKHNLPLKGSLLISV